MNTQNEQQYPIYIYPPPIWDQVTVLPTRTYDPKITFLHPPLVPLPCLRFSNLPTLKDLDPGESCPHCCWIDNLGGLWRGTQKRKSENDSSSGETVMSLMWLVHMTCGLSCWVITLPVTIQISVHSHSSENFPEPLAKTLHIIYQNNAKVSFDVSCPSPSQAPSSFHCIWKQFIILKPPPLLLIHPCKARRATILSVPLRHHCFLKSPQGVTESLTGCPLLRLKASRLSCDISLCQPFGVKFNDFTGTPALI